MFTKSLSEWESAFHLVQFYRWCAMRKFTLPGNNPLTGIPREKLFYPQRTYSENESRVAYVAMAKYWLEICRRNR